jgi:hypothetical protein
MAKISNWRHYLQCLWALSKGQECLPSHQPEATAEHGDGPHTKDPGEDLDQTLRTNSTRDTRRNVYS